MVWKQDNTIVNEKPDDDVVSLDGLGSDVSVDEDAVPMQKVTINNKVRLSSPQSQKPSNSYQPALRSLTDSIRVTNMSWPEHLVVDSKETADVDPSDGEYRLTYSATCFADNRIKICKEKQFCEHFLLNLMDVVDIHARSYKIALGCVPQARKLASKHDLPFTRPGDYYAEMVKSDEHMERVRTKLVEEAYVFILPNPLLV